MTATPPASERWSPAGLVLIIVIMCVGLLIRAMPLLVTGVAEATAGYDEGVYLAAAGLTAEGALPYRDFTFLHPPGVLLVLTPFAALSRATWGWDGLLVLGRWLAVALGGCTLLGLAAVVRRWRGLPGAVGAVAVYAAYLPAAFTERHLKLEALVNVAVVVTAWIWLAPAPVVSSRRAIAAGVSTGAATLVKLTGALVWPALLASRPSGCPRWRLATVSIAAAAVLLAGLAPFAVAAGPGAIVDQLLVAQLQRPGGDVAGGGIDAPGERVGHLMQFGVLGASRLPEGVRIIALLALLVLMGWAGVRGGRDGRFWATFFLVTLLAVLLAPDYYGQYAAPIGMPVAAVFGAMLGGLVASAWKRGQPVRKALAIGLCIVLVAGLPVALRSGWRAGQAGVGNFGALVESQVPVGACLIADPPALMLAAGRLPPRDPSGSFLVDPFGALLRIGLSQASGAELGSTTAVIRSPVAQQRLRVALGACRFVGLRGDPDQQHRFSPATAAWFIEIHERLDELDGGAALWVRRGGG